MSGGGRGLRICVLSGSSRTVAHAYGLSQDARIIEQILREASAGGSIKIDSVEHGDAYTYGTGNRATGMVDINIHLENGGILTLGNGYWSRERRAVPTLLSSNLSTLVICSLTWKSLVPA